MQKKGAIEFSMTTIMVVIIGVAVLALGLAWIRGTFTQVTQLTESSLDNAETILGEIAFTGKISAPATINMKSGGDAKKFRVLIRNTKPALDTFTMTFSAPNQLSCIIPSGSGTAVRVEPNEVGELTGGLVSTCTSGNGVLQIVVADSGGSYATEAIAIQMK